MHDAMWVTFTETRCRATHPEASACMCQCRATLRQEHNAAFEHDHRRDGAIAGRRRGDHRPSLRDLRVEKVLVPSLRVRQIVVMDNLAAHKPKRVRELIESRDCELLYLPAYSPDYNPIEKAFSKIKRFLREVGARTKEALVEAIGAALSAVSPKDARSFFEHAGYQQVGQLL